MVSTECRTRLGKTHTMWLPPAGKWKAQSRKAGSHPVTAPADLSRHHRATVLQSRKPFISDGKPAMNLNRKGLFFILKAERLQQDAERKFKYSVFHRRVEVYYFLFFRHTR